MPRLRQLDPELVKEATEWFLTLQAIDLSLEQCEAFAVWLRRSPVHVEEFLQIAALHGDLSCNREFRSLDVDELLGNLDPVDTKEGIVTLSSRFDSRDADLDTAPDLDSESLAVAPVSDGRWWRAAHMPNARIMAALAAAVGVIAVGVIVLRSRPSEPMPQFQLRQHYQTGIAEQRFVALSDGSRVELGADSSLSAAVNTNGRELQLDDGEALFEVAKDRARPFRVHTPQATIEATGTQFNVDVVDSAAVISLVEGHVLVTAPGSAPVLLNPGEQVSVPRGTSGPLQPHAVDVSAATAWVWHRLVFDDVPLSTIAAEFNRYSSQPFIIDDPSLRSMRFTANFDLDSVQSFADSLSASGAVRVTHLQSGAYLIERK